MNNLLFIITHNQTQNNPFELKPPKKMRKKLCQLKWHNFTSIISIKHNQINKSSIVLIHHIVNNIHTTININWKSKNIQSKVIILLLLKLKREKILFQININHHQHHFAFVLILKIDFNSTFKLLLDVKWIKLNPW